MEQYVHNQSYHRNNDIVQTKTIQFPSPFDIDSSTRHAIGTRITGNLMVLPNLTNHATTLSIPVVNSTFDAMMGSAFVYLNGSDLSGHGIGTGANYETLATTCPVPIKQRYPSMFGFDLAVPQWEAILITVCLLFIILLTIVGNILVILSVFTYKPLRIVQNFFIVSLAVADLTVAILVLPFNVVNMIVGRWIFGIHLCKMWLTSDILCCTSSILNLCAIALDRYWAITDPINYAQKRTVERVLALIAGVWILSLVISSPPLIGWNDWPEVFDSEKHPCALNSNPGYRIYSSFGSFFIPLIIMTIVYIEIYVATRRRLRERARASRINAMNMKGAAGVAGATIGSGGKEPNTTRGVDQESISSETNHNEHPNVPDSKATARHVEKAKHRKEKQRHKAKDSLKLMDKNQSAGNLKPLQREEESITDIRENSSESMSKPIHIETPPSVEDALTSGGTTTFNPHVDSDERKKDTSGSMFGMVAAIANARRKHQKSVRKQNSVYQFIEEKQKISLSKERRAARTLGIIMGVFILCWVPFFLLYVIVPFCSTCCPSDLLIDFLTWLGYVNSALNPIIYTIFNLDYRRAFKKLLGIKI